MFAAFDDATFESALDAMISRRVISGEALTRTGEPASSLFIIVHGRIDGYLTLGGKRTHLGHMSSGEICGAVPYFTGGRSATEVVAAEDSELLELPYSQLDKLRESSGEFSRRIDALYRNHILIIQLALAPIFRLLDAETRKMLVEKMEMLSLGAGELLFRENDVGSDIYLIRSGAIGLNLLVNGSERQLKPCVPARYLARSVSPPVAGVRPRRGRSLIVGYSSWMAKPTGSCLMSMSGCVMCWRGVG